MISQPSTVGSLAYRRGFTVLSNLMFAILYWVVGSLGLYLVNSTHPVASFWPVAGLGLAAMFYRRFSLWPGLLLGAFVLAWQVLHSIPAAAGAAIASTIQAFAGAFLYQRLYRQSSMEPFTDLAAWGTASLLAPVPSSIFGTASLWACGIIPRADFLTVAATWWAGDAIGILTVAPIICWSGWWKARYRLKFQIRPLLVGVLLTFLGLSLCYFVFFVSQGSLFLFLVFPFLFLATVAFGPPGVRIAALGVVIFIVLAARLERTPFVIAGQAGTILQFEAFLLVIGLVAQLLGSLHKARSLRLAGAVLLMGWAVSGWLFAALQGERMRLDAFQLNSLVAECQGAIKARMETYVNALQAGASLFDASESVERDEWRRFTESLNLATRYPGINGLGVVFPVKEADKAKFLAHYAMGRELSIHPIPTDTPVQPDPAGWKYFVVTYLEPENTNAAAIGSDLATEAKRQHAARVARDYGIPQISGRITLIQDDQQRPGFVLFVPMYLPNEIHETVHTRRAAFRGWIVAPFLFENFFHDILGNLEPQLSLQLFEGLSTSPKDLVFRSGTDSGQPFARSNVLQLGGRQFTCGWTLGAEFKTAVRDPLWNAASLAIVPGLLAGLVATLQISGRRANEIADERTHELVEVNERLEVQIAERQLAESEAQAAREAAETANNAKSDFLATMSHEIRTPMNGVIGYTDLLANSELSDEQHLWANNIQSSGRTLLAIINDILDFSKIEAGKLELERIAFDPLQATREVIDLSEAQATSKNLPIYLERSTSLPEAIMGDPVRFKQILLNLVSNAIKFTEKGAVRVRLEWTSEINHLRVSVSDTGLGIPAEKQARLFQRFSQVDSSTTRRFGGTGLGLAISKHLVELMKGTISATSTLGLGTTVAFDIPTEAPAQKPALAKTEPAPPDVDEKKIGEGKRVLLAEDVVLNQKLATTLLTRLGCTVEIASNGREAMEKACSQSYDLIFMDCQMPIMDGYEAARAIRRAETHGRVPIVALTANALEGDRDKCLVHGMDDYISKPFAKRDFIRTIVSWSSTKLS